MSEAAHLAHPEDDSFVAYLDGELDGPERARVDALLASDRTAAARFAFLSRSSLPFAEAYAPLLDAAPVERLQAGLAAAGVGVGVGGGEVVPAAPGGARLGRRGLLAASLALLVAGGVIGRLLPRGPDRSAAREEGPDERTAWRAVMAAQVRLYAPATFAPLDPNDAALATDLARAGQSIGMDLHVPMIDLPGLPIKRVQVLNYDGRPFVQVAYLDPAHGPVALCIGRALGVAATMRTEERLGMNIAFWSTKSFDFAVLGRAPPADVEKLAFSISPRVRNAT